MVFFSYKTIENIIRKVGSKSVEIHSAWFSIHKRNPASSKSLPVYMLLFSFYLVMVCSSGHEKPNKYVNMRTHTFRIAISINQAHVHSQPYQRNLHRYKAH